MELEQRMSGIIENAISSKVSDLFLMPKLDHYQVLYRCSDRYVDYEELSREDSVKLISLIKYRANMLISEHRRPQNGSMIWEGEKGKINLRVASVGDFLDREAIVIRFIYEADTTSVVRNNFEWEKIKECLYRRGMIAFAGPMGSGKTTSIYKLAKSLIPEWRVLSIEDPVEIDDDDFLQLQVNEEAGMDYSNLLKSGLRHRPDVFIIGEIRDAKTAEIAIQAALSGHLVLTTVHAQSAEGVKNRLRELGIGDSFLEQALTASVYQRLVPTVTGKMQLILDVEINKKTNSNQKKWSKKIQELFDNGEITKEVFKEFEFG